MSTWLLLGGGSLVAAAAMTVAVGTAALRRVDLYRWVAQGRRGAAAAGAVLASPGRIHRAATGVVAVGILLASMGLPPAVARLPLQSHESQWLALITVVFVAVPLLLVIVYSIPRALGRRWPESVVAFGVPWMQRWASVFAPLTPTPAQPRRRAALNALLQARNAEELLDSEELTVLSGVFAFTERPVREVMTPRTDIIAVREGASLEEVGQLLADSGYSRIPVYRDSLDNITGMIYAFDLLRIVPGAELPLRPVTIAPAPKRCADLLFEMQRERRQFAVVLDEYGGTAGIVTFEDLLKELVGEIFDEHDAPPHSERPAPEIVEASGATPVEEIAARFAVALPADAETVGGLLARAAGRIPRAGERYAVAGLEFDILSSSPTRVERVLIRHGPVLVIDLVSGGAA